MAARIVMAKMSLLLTIRSRERAYPLVSPDCGGTQPPPLTVLAGWFGGCV